MAQVQRIDPVILPGKETVAAYCRVSTDSKDQINSYQTQIAYYTQLIAENPEWELVDIYADAGITGTSIEKRDEFKRLLADCRAGKIKRVLVKSVSRFARNTLELLETTRELKELGVVVVFEEQGIDTSQMLGEMQLTMFALAAQEESTSISQNMRRSYQMRMENGTFVTTHTPIGFDKKDNILTANQDAEIVRIIFSLYNSGMGMERIAKHLNEHFPGVRNWRRTTIDKIIRNEKYAGDSLFQKTYTTSSIPFKQKPNCGNLPQYFYSQSHKGIISHTEFENSQSLIKDRSSAKAKQQPHLFTHRIICPECGKHFRHISASGKSYWLCTSHSKNCETLNRISEISVISTSLNMLSKLFLNQDSNLPPTLSLLREIEYTQTGTDSKLYELDKAIADLNDKALVLQRLQNKGFITAEEFRARNDALAAQRVKLAAERKRKLSGSKAHEMIEKIEELQAILASWPGVPTEFDINVFDEIVEKIIPAEGGALRFRLRCGLEIKEAMPK